MYEKLMIDFLVEGEKVEIYNRHSKVTFYSTYNEKLSYVKNVLAIFSDYAITDYAIDEKNENKAYFELIKIKF